MTDTRTRPVRLWLLVLPVVLALVIMILITLALALPGSPLRLQNQQLTIVGETILILMILCPMVLCMIIPYALLMVGVYFMQKAHNNTSRVMDKVRGLVHTATEKTIQTADVLSEKSITMNTRGAFFSRLLHIFDRRTRPEAIDERTE